MFSIKRTTTQAAALAVAVLAVAASPSPAAQPAAAGTVWSATAAAPHVPPPSKRPHRLSKRARRHAVARLTAFQGTGYAYCGRGRITFTPPSVSSAPLANDWIRWRPVVYVWLGTHWGPATYLAWHGYFNVTQFGTDLPTSADILVPSNLYYHVQYQAEHYYSGQSYFANDVSHFSNNGYYAYTSVTDCRVG